MFRILARAIEYVLVWTGENCAACLENCREPKLSPSQKLSQCFNNKLGDKLEF